MPFLLIVAAVAVVIAAVAVAKQPAQAAPLPPSPLPPQAKAPSPTAMPQRPTISSVAAGWPGFIVVDVAKFKDAYARQNWDTTPPANAPFVAVGPQPFRDMQAPSAGVGTIPAFLGAQLAAKKRVWIGPATMDATAEKAVEYVLPIYVGTTPPAGYQEIAS